MEEKHQSKYYSFSLWSFSYNLIIKKNLKRKLLFKKKTFQDETGAFAITIISDILEWRWSFFKSIQKGKRIWYFVSTKGKMSNVCISLCLLFLLNGFESVLIETHLYSIFPTDTSYFTIAKFNTPSQMTCIHKCLRLSSKMFYNNNDGGLCVCFNDSNEKAGNLYEKKSSDLDRNKGVVMEVIKSHYTQVIYF